MVEDYDDDGGLWRMIEVEEEGREDRVIGEARCWVTTNSKRSETNETNETRPATCINKKDFQQRL